MNPLVTISIPLFKCEDFLEKCLDSVRFQTYKNLEVILVNDQTPDNSVQIAENFIQKYQLQNWKIIHLEKNSGLSVVRNKGIDEARGKYLFFLDSDDEILPDTISKMVAHAEKEDLQMVVGSVISKRLEDGKRLDVFPIKSFETLRGNRAIFETFVNGDYPVSSWNKLVRLDFLRNNQLYFTAGLFAQDALQSFKTALKLDSIGFLRDITYIYYLHQNSVIHNRTERHFNNWITIAKAIDVAYAKENDKTKKQLILKYLNDFKTGTLQMNWKAQKNETLWKNNYKAYSKLNSLGVSEYFSGDFTTKMKKEAFYNSLPVNLAYRTFKWRYEDGTVPGFIRVVLLGK